MTFFLNKLLSKYYNHRGKQEVFKPLPFFNKAVMFDPDNAEALVNRAGAKYSVECLENDCGDERNRIVTEIIADLDKAISIKNNYAVAYATRGEFKSILGESSEALNDLNTALHLNPKLTDVYSSRSIVKMALKDYEGALEDLNKLTMPGYLTHIDLSRRALAKFYLKDYQGSVADFEEAIRMEYAENKASEDMMRELANAMQDEFEEQEFKSYVESVILANEELKSSEEPEIEALLAKIQKV